VTGEGEGKAGQRKPIRGIDGLQKFEYYPEEKKLRWKNEGRKSQGRRCPRGKEDMNGISGCSCQRGKDLQSTGCQPKEHGKEE